MGLLDSADHCPVFLFLGLVDRVLQVDTLDGHVGRDLYDVHTVDVTEFTFFCQGCTGHTALLVEFVEEVLEGNGRQGAALLFDLDMLLGFDGLMQAVAVASAGHDTACKLIDDQDLVVLDDIVMVQMHQVVGPQGQDDAVLDLQVLGVRQVLNMEETLHLADAFRGQVDDFILLIDNEITGLLLLDAHDGVDLGQVIHVFAAFHLLGQDIAGFIDLGGLAALAGNDQRGPCFVDQDRVHFVDDGVMEPPQDQLTLVDGHIVTQIVKSQLVVGHVGDVASVGFLTFRGGHAVEDNAYSQSQELVDLSHPLRVSFGQVIVDGNDMDALSFQGVQVSRHGGYQRLAFTGTHLGDTALVQDDSADQLHTEGLHIQNSPGRLAA